MKFLRGLIWPALLLVAAIALLVGVWGDWGSPAAAQPARAQAGDEKVYLPSIAAGYMPALPTVFGVDISPITVSNGLDKMRAAGAYWLRRGPVNWYAVEPVKPASPDDRQWDALDGLVSELLRAQARDMQVILVVGGTPAWAQKVPGYTCGPVLESELAAFGDFMAALVARYSVPPYNVKYWELWNEPDISPTLLSDPNSGFGCWGDENDADYGGGYYAAMLQEVYPRIKQADPQANVLVGGLLLDCNPDITGACTDNLHGDLSPRFLRGILAAGGGAYFDGVSFHAYDYYLGTLGNYFNKGWKTSSAASGPVVNVKADYIRDLLSQSGYTGKLLINSEAALVCDDAYMDCGDGDPANPYEITKAYYVTQVYAVAIAEAFEANIWYSVLGWRNSGLLNADLTSRLAYQAYQVTRRELADAAFTRKIDNYASVEVYEFTRSGRRIWVLWSRDIAAAYPVNLPSLPVAIYDALGNPQPLTTALSVSVKPLIVEWIP